MGLVVSPTFTVKLALPMLPCASVARHVTVVDAIANVVPEAGEHDGDSCPSTLSLADALKLTATPAAEVASRVMSAGTLTLGGVVSRMVTWKVLVPVLPCASVAWQATVVAPMANVAPDAGKQIEGIVPSMLSCADVEKLTDAPALDVASCVMSAGTLTTGGVVSVSVTVTENEPVLVLPWLSLAEQFTTVVPVWKLAPDGGEHDVATLPSMSSTAVAENVTAVPSGLVVWAV